MPSGLPGQINRVQHALVDTAILDGTNYPTSYGVPVAIDATSKGLRKIMAGDTVANVIGFYPRPYPTNNSTDGLGTSTPATAGPASVLRRGYIFVKLNAGTAAKNGKVYCRTVANGGNTIIGGIEAAADSTNTFEITNAKFTGAADANGAVEIEFNL